MDESSLCELLATVASDEVAIESRVPAAVELGGVQDVVKNEQWQGTKTIQSASGISTTGCLGEGGVLGLVFAVTIISDRL